MTEKPSNRFSPEVRRRAVRPVPEGAGEHPTRWPAIGPAAAKSGCTAETPRQGVRQAERGRGLRAGPTTAERERVESMLPAALERERRALRQANGSLRKASAYSAQAELDRRSRP